jgi:hypothetical protein
MQLAGQTDGHGTSKDMASNRAPGKCTRVGVRKASTPSLPGDVDQPAPSVTTTNSNPMKVAPDVLAMM